MSVEGIIYYEESIKRIIEDFKVPYADPNMDLVRKRILKRLKAII